MSGDFSNTPTHWDPDDDPGVPTPIDLPRIERAVRSIMPLCGAVLVMDDHSTDATAILAANRRALGLMGRRSEAGLGLPAWLDPTRLPPYDPSTRISPPS
ncbi:MAG: hypothetical protein HUU16_09360, partial [Candidatus Omnitrophica bacterium]|nr:hypothetical protein [Candidatus Omnitrophota bacterium]